MYRGPMELFTVNTLCRELAKNMMKLNKCSDMSDGSVTSCLISKILIERPTNHWEVTHSLNNQGAKKQKQIKIKKLDKRFKVGERRK